MNEENLRVPSSSEAREYGRKGGLARAANVKRRKELQEQWQALLDAVDTRGMTIQEIMNRGIAKRAADGDPNAYEKAMEYAGLSVKQRMKEEELRLKREELNLKKKEAERKNPPSDSGPTIFEQMIRELYERPD